MRGLRNISGLAKWRKNDAGATAVEFALVAGPFFFVIGCIVETGLMLFTEYVLQASVQEAARLVRTGQAQEDTMGSSELKEIVCNTAGIVIDCSGDVTIFMQADTTFANLQSALPSYLSVGTSYGGSPASSSFECGDASEAVALVATYDWDFTMPLMNLFGNVDGDTKRRLAGFAMFKNEPFPTTSSCS